MNTKEHIDYWVNTAQHDFETAVDLFNIKRYDWCLFLGHLVLEKILKAHYVKNVGKVPPKIHNLLRLAELSEIELTVEQKTFFDLVNQFQIEARYPQVKSEFYRMATPEFSTLNFKKIEETFKWFKSLLKY